jgi:transcriptional regulator with PAS, ATPase and Fis domain
VNVRVIAATNRPLSDMVAQGTFREDLFYRLNVIHLIVPPLRQRKQDIRPMIDRFLQQFARANRSPVEAISPDAIEALVDHPWPGNVRELQNVIERLVVVGRSATVQLSDLPAELRSSRRCATAPVVVPAVDVADDLYGRLTQQRESFWTTVYPLYMQREITRTDVRDVVRKGLEEARGNYKIMVELFNMEAGDYKKFLNFLRKHQCQLPFKDYRQVGPLPIKDYRQGSAGQAAHQ